MKYYIYTLEHPITGEIRYIGKTNNISRRYSNHLCDKSKSHKSSWIKSLLNQDLLPKIQVLDEFNTEQECFENEIYWVNQFKQWGFNLTNHQNGGWGGKSEQLELESNPNSKITINQVLSIKEELLKNNYSLDKIAELNNCTKAIVSNIKKGISWSKITGFTGKEIWKIPKESIENRANALKANGLYKKLGTPIYQFDLNGNLIKEYDSISEASKETKTNRTSLIHCLNNKLKTANKFIWKRKQK